jgi:hypothetical protein
MKNINVLQLIKEKQQKNEALKVAQLNMVKRPAQIF